jgi:hypothetical protein
MPEKTMMRPRQTMLAFAALVFALFASASAQAGCCGFPGGCCGAYESWLTGCCRGPAVQPYHSYEHLRPYWSQPRPGCCAAPVPVYVVEQGPYYSGPDQTWVWSLPVYHQPQLVRGYPYVRTDTFYDVPAIEPRRRIKHRYRRYRG